MLGGLNSQMAPDRNRFRALLDSLDRWPARVRGPGTPITSFRCETAAPGLQYLILDGRREGTAIRIQRLVGNAAARCGLRIEVARVESHRDTGRDVFAIRDLGAAAIQ